MAHPVVQLTRLAVTIVAWPLVPISGNSGPLFESGFQLPRHTEEVVFKILSANNYNLYRINWQPRSDKRSNRRPGLTWDAPTNLSGSSRQFVPILDAPLTQLRH